MAGRWRPIPSLPLAHHVFDGIGQGLFSVAGKRTYIERFPGFGKTFPTSSAMAIMSPNQASHMMAAIRDAPAGPPLQTLDMATIVDALTSLKTASEVAQSIKLRLCSAPRTPSTD